MNISIHLDDEIIEAAKQAAQTESRSLSQQIEYWARLGRSLAESTRQPTPSAVDDPFVRIPPPQSEAARRQALRDALTQIAAKGTFADIDDPVAWQREQRRDRPLPGRED